MKINILKRVYASYILAIILISTVTNTNAQNTYLDLDTTDNLTTSLPKEIVNTNGSNFVEIQYRFPGAFVMDKSVDDDVYNYIHIDGFGKMGYVGKPALPAYHNIVAIPENALPEISITHSEYTEYVGYMIHPALEPAIDSDTIQPVFTMDSSLYNTNELFPENIVSINYIQKLRGIPLAFVQICPIQFNPVTKTIRMYSEITYRVNFTGTEKSYDIIATENSSDFIKTLKNVIKNPESIPESESDSISTRSNGKDYIIITHSDYDNAAAELAQWKQQLGYSVEIVSDDNWTASEVKNQIHTRYNNWVPHPDYFVIIGDHEDVPAEIINGDFPSDLYYACMDGTNDWVPDMAHGRISVSSPSQAISVIQKIIDYEKSPINDVGFYSKGLHAAYFQDKRYLGDTPDGYAARRFAQTSEEIYDYMKDEQGFSPERVYYTESNIFPTHWNSGSYSNGEPIPICLRKPSFPWDGNASDILSEVNDGRLYVIHRDHGDVQEWGKPNFTCSDIGLLNNGNKLPVVASINCLTGKFNNGLCFAEMFLRKNPGGAVGVFAHSDESYSGYNDGLAIGLFDAIWATPGLVANFTGTGDDPGTISSHNDIYNMGYVGNQGLIRMLETWGNPSGRAQKTHETFHYFGDPAMKIWTDIPNDNLLLSVFPEACVTSEMNDFVVSVNNIDSGVEAKLTLYKENEILDVVDIVGDNNNEATVVFENIVCNSEGSLYFTVSSHNYAPHEAVIPVVDWSFTCDSLCTIPLNVKSSQAWYDDKYLNRNIIIENNILLSIYSSIYLQEDVEITVKDGAILSLRSGSVISKECSNQWEGITVKDGGRLYVYGEIEHFNNINVEQGAKIYYGSSANLALNNHLSVLEISGALHINSNATFTFTGDGYIKFSNPGGDSNNNIFCGSGASIVLQGSGQNDKIMEVQQSSVRFPAELSSLELRDGKIEMGNGKRMLAEGDYPLTFDNIKITSDNGVYNAHRSFHLYGQANVTVSDCIFEYGYWGLYGNLTYASGAPLAIFNSEFKNNKIGLYIYNKGLTLTNCTFGDNTQVGLHADNMSFESSFNSCYFLNNNQGINYQGSASADLTLNACEILNSTYDGIMTTGGFDLDLNCTWVRNNQDGISTNLGTKVDIANNANNDLSNNVNAIRLNNGYLLADNGYNNLSSSNYAVIGEAVIRCNPGTSPDLVAEHNRWDSFNYPPGYLQNHKLWAFNCNQTPVTILDSNPNSVFCPHKIYSFVNFTNEVNILESESSSESLSGQVDNLELSIQEANTATVCQQLLSESITLMENVYGIETAEAYSQSNRIWSNIHNVIDKHYKIIGRDNENLAFNQSVDQVMQLNAQLMLDADAIAYYEYALDNALLERLRGNFDESLLLLDNLIPELEGMDKEIAYVNRWICHIEAEREAALRNITPEEFMDAIATCNTDYENTLESLSDNLETDENAEETSTAPEIHSVPNPNNGNFTLEISDCTEGSSVRISNVYSQPVFTQIFTESGTQTVQITGLSQGHYTVYYLENNAVISSENIVVE